VVDGADHPRPSVLELVSRCPPAARVGSRVLDRVCRAAVSELRLLGAVVTLMSSTETQAVSAASNATTRRLGEEQFGLLRIGGVGGRRGCGLRAAPPDRRRQLRRADPVLPGDPWDLDFPAVLDTQGHIYQAQGMVMVELGVGLAEALARMRAYAYAMDQLLSTLATDIVAGRTAIPRDGPGGGTAGWANGGANGGNQAEAGGKMNVSEGARP
jgi:hypothetical protein